MAKSKHVRLFVTVATRRLEDALYLKKVNRSVAAAYLAGYSVECHLKALILSAVFEHEQPKIIASYRGSRAHEYRWLRSQYLANGGARAPNFVADAFIILDSWGVELRYNPRSDFDGDIDAFFEAIETVRAWINGRI